MAEAWSVTVYGTPAPKGSMKCIGARGKVKHQLVEDDSSGGGKAWRALMRQAGEQLRRTAGEQLQAGPVSVEVTMTLDRPASAPAARLWPALRNLDVDKGARLVLDGLQDSGLFHDDSQVVDLHVRKTYPDTPGCPDRLTRPGAVIRIWPTEETLLDA